MNQGRQGVIRTSLCVLRRTMELIAEQGSLAKGADARDADGQAVSFDSPAACSFCLLGALHRAIQESTADRNQILVVLREPIMRAIHTRAGLPPPSLFRAVLFHWNDLPTTSLADVRAVLTQANLSLEQTLADAGS